MPIKFLNKGLRFLDLNASRVITTPKQKEVFCISNRYFCYCLITRINFSLKVKDCINVMRKYFH